MASAARLLETLNREGIMLSTVGDKLVVEPASKLNSELRESIRSHKADLIEVLAGGRPLADDFDERAALAEIGAGVPREWAEGFARLQVIRPPSGIAIWRWQQVVDDAGRFLDGWATQAAALGWRMLDVFGVHPEKPVERFDAAGLIWCIRGGEVIAIAETTAKLRAPSGAVQTYNRRDPEHPEAVAVWTLEARS
ncbi:MAG: hypothetical protein FJX60_22820 [Alphaproteobacteria bacterium]|nr:hypothetical protein [Alphaproteobacteria bacterium]